MVKKKVEERYDDKNEDFKLQMNEIVEKYEEKLEEYGYDIEKKVRDEYDSKVKYLSERIEKKKVKCRILKGKVENLDKLVVETKLEKDKFTIEKNNYIKEREEEFYAKFTQFTEKENLFQKVQESFLDQKEKMIQKFVEREGDYQELQDRLVEVEKLYRYSEERNKEISNELISLKVIYF